MAEDAKITLPPPYPQIITPTIALAENKAKKQISRKHVVWAVAAVAIVMTVVAGFSIGGYFFSKTTLDVVKHYHMQFKSSDGTDVDETIDNNVKENTQLYHMRDSSGEKWLLKDFNRDIDIYKTEDEGKVLCFVSPMNTSWQITPKEMDEKIPTNPPIEDKLENSKEMEVFYKADREPIPFPSFLGSKVTDLCGDHDIHWLYPSCSPSVPDEDVKHRQKRGWFRDTIKKVSNSVKKVSNWVKKVYPFRFNIYGYDAELGLTTNPWGFRVTIRF